ncbi:hypothetical protein LINPERPRIM_LOCUS2914, partial [Linum perenne]
LYTRNNNIGCPITNCTLRFHYQRCLGDSIPSFESQQLLPFISCISFSSIS